MSDILMYLVLGTRYVFLKIKQGSSLLSTGDGHGMAWHGTG
jgi:hypothetical protein